MGIDFGSVLGGVGGGALAGIPLAGATGGWSIPIGAVLGGGMSALSSSNRNNAASAQKQSIDEAMARLRQSSQEQYQNRMQDLDKAMSFYGPAQNALMAYGQPTPSLYRQPGASPAPPPGMPPIGRATGGMVL